MYKGEFRKLLTPFNILLISALIVLNLLITFYQYKDTLSGDGVLIREKIDELVELNNSSPEKYAAIREDFSKRKRDYDTLFYLNLNDDSKQMIIFENLFIDLTGYGDIQLFNALDDIISAPDKYLENINSMLISTAARYYDIDDDDRYLRDYYLNILSIYDPLSEIDIPIENVTGWNEFFSLKTPIVFLSLASLALYCQVFTIDQRSGMGVLMHIYKNGSRTASKAKLLFTVITSTALTLIFTLTPLCVFSIFGGLSSADIPMQLLDDFTFFRYELTVSQYLIIFCAVRVLLFIGLSLLLASLGKIFSSEIPSFIALIVITAIGVIFCRIPSSSLAYWLYKFSPINLAGVNILFNRYRGLHFFGGFADYTISVLAITVLLIAAICVLVLLHRSPTAIRVRHEKRSTDFGSSSMSIPKTEFYKQLIANSGVYILLGALIAKCIISAVYYYNDPSSSELVYMEYIDYVAGEITDDKLEYIAEEGKYIQAALDEHSAMVTAYQQGELSGDDYNAHMGRYNYAKYCENAFNRLDERKEYLLSVSEQYDNVVFIYEKGIKLFFDSPIDIAALLAFVLLMSQVFSIEYDSGFYRILRCSKHGRRKLFFSKLIFSLITAAMINIIFLTIDIAFLLKSYDVRYLSSSIMSIPDVSDIDMSILRFVIIKKVISLVGSVICSLFIAVIGILLEKGLKTMILSAIMIFIPIALKYYGVGIFELVNFAAITAPGNNIPSALSVMIVLTAATVIISAISSCKWNGIKSLKG